MPNAKDLQKTPIYRISDGVHLGDIKDLYLDFEARRVVALYLGREGLLSRKTLAVRREAIQVLGQDAWLAADGTEVADLREMDDSSTFLLAGDIRGREIETDGGTRVGTVGDVILDAEGSVEGFSLGKTHLQGKLADAKRVAASAVTSLGDKQNPMIVDLEAAERAVAGD